MKRSLGALCAACALGLLACRSEVAREPSRDASTPEADAGAGTDAGEPQPAPIFQDDFTRDDGPVAPPWRDSGPGSPELWAGALCLQASQSVTLELTPAPYRYLRIAASGADGLVWSVEGPRGPLFSLEWLMQRDGTREVEFSAGEDVAPYSSARAHVIEVLLDDETGLVSARAPGRPWVTSSLASELGDGITKLRFTLASPDFGTACFDDVYVGPAEPASDPFAGSPPVRHGGFVDDPREACALDHCGESAVRCLEQQDVPDPELPCADCDCDISDYLTALSCPDSSPSGRVAGCPGLWEAPDSATLAELSRCLDEHCAVDVTQKPVPLQGFTGQLLLEPMSPYALVLSGDKLLVAEVSTLSQKVELDFAQTVVSGLTADELPIEARMFAPAFLHATVQTRARDGTKRFFYLQRGSYREMDFALPIVDIHMAPGRAAGWVETQRPGEPATRTRQIVTWDSERWYVAYRSTEAAEAVLAVAFPPRSDSSYALISRPQGWSVLGDARETALEPGPGMFELRAALADSVVLEDHASGDYAWLMLDGRPSALTLPGGRVSGPHVLAADGIWVHRWDGYARLADPPPGFDPAQDALVTSSETHLLFQQAGGWSIHDVAGSALGTFAPGDLAREEASLPLSAERAVTLGPTCGVFLSSADEAGSPLTVVDGFRLDESGALVTRRLDVLAGAPRDQAIVRPSTSLLAWLDATAVRVFYCHDGLDFTIPRVDGLLSLSESIDIPVHLYAPLEEEF
jgi:hypothetical protein